MISFISSELLKLRTSRSFYVAAAVALLYAVLPAVLVRFPPPGASVPPIDARMLTGFLQSPARLASGAVLVVGLLAAAGEFRYRTILTTRLVAPRAHEALLAKLVAVAMVGLSLAVVVEVLAGASATALLVSRDVPVQPWAYGAPRVFVLTAVLVAVHGVLGVAIGSLLRSTAAAVGVTLGWLLVVEGAVPLLTNRPWLAQWLPGSMVDQVLADHTAHGAPSPLAAGVLIAAYAALLMSATMLLDRARET
jgi:ABC-2 type transport system permease protein